MGSGKSCFCFFSVLLLLAVFLLQLHISYSSKVYVVYMGSKTHHGPDDILRQNHHLLAAVHGGSYRHGFRGFAAKLTDDQASQIADMPGVVSVFPNEKRKLHTTHSWDFMGLAGNESAGIPGYSTEKEANVIVGFIDTGIWPESPSFSDARMPPVPIQWKGQCQTGEAFNASSCNRKVIGARYYFSGYEAEEDSVNTVSYRSPRDSSGHGSHTASTAAGRHVTNVNYKGLAAGGARGGAPMARVAVYKTCWDSGCYDVDLLAAFDDAIRDGVHILSLSIGPDAPQGDYFNDAISVGSFHAASHGILVVASVGNAGSQGSATNVAPWMITVAAGSTDRDFMSDILLGDGSKFTGESLSRFKMNASARIISASEAYAGYFTPYQSSYCLESSLSKTKTRGKILVCRHAESSMQSKVAKSLIVKEAGGIGMILIDDEDKDVAIPFLIPSAMVGRSTGNEILSYINNTRKPTAMIFPAKTVLGSQPAPRIAAFSSKGPNSLTPEILKPDITAPGLNILAAWSPAVGKMHFNILSGTSMACPHVTGIAALIKSIHPSWSPSAIKSAIMTTATIKDKNHKVITVDPEGRRGNSFDYGSGFAEPRRATDPGLIYDAQPEDYRAFLCSLGYDEKLLHLITGDNETCTQSLRTASDLNYPSIAVPDLKDSFSVNRTVTNVGRPGSIYKAVVSSPHGINATVSPNRLVFNSYGQKIMFTVHFKMIAPTKGYTFGFLSWKSRKIQVTTPLVVRVVASNMGLMR
ncbi:subtilisin-like protease SBT3.5 isoform X2 [Carica papaya]|uniref:subtilisin-like protease SBT3.5 isoform X2 n=1 Tax=Carica papaya TaxID=3649 RepID=UPI000B8CD4FE|nr:subtilisin-like protease SBT3.5 isoform X2 [Carica papaya]